MNWLHKLFNPHCPHCKEQEEDDKVCASCETLKMQLAIANAEKKTLLDALVDRPKINIEPDKVKLDPEKTNARVMTWNMRRQMLEAEDRNRAEILRRKAEEEKLLKPSKTISELEKELEIPNDETVGRNDETAIQSREDEGIKEERQQASGE